MSLQARIDTVSREFSDHTGRLIETIGRITGRDPTVSETATILDLEKKRTAADGLLTRLTAARDELDRTERREANRHAAEDAIRRSAARRSRRRPN